MNHSISFLRKGLLGLTILGSALMASSANATDVMAAIAGRVFCDTDCDGLINPDVDELLMKTKVSLLDENGNVLQVTTPEAFGGTYIFTNLVVGKKYIVQVHGAVGQEVLQSFPSANAVRLNKSRISVLVISQVATYYPNDFLLDCGSKTWNQCEWGKSGCYGKNPIELLEDHFDTLFPNGLIVGGNKTITFTHANAVKKFLPSSGSPKKLNASRVDPYSHAESELAGNVTALVLNLKLSEEGITGEGLGDNYFESGPFEDMTLDDFSELANLVLGGQTNLLPNGVSISDLNKWVEYVNNKDWSGCDCDCNCDKKCSKGKDKGKCKDKNKGKCEYKDKDKKKGKDKQNKNKKKGKGKRKGKGC